MVGGVFATGRGSVRHCGVYSGVGERWLAAEAAPKGCAYATAKPACAGYSDSLQALWRLRTTDTIPLRREWMPCLRCLRVGAALAWYLRAVFETHRRGYLWCSTYDKESHHAVQDR